MVIFSWLSQTNRWLLTPAMDDEGTLVYETN